MESQELKKLNEIKTLLRTTIFVANEYWQKVRQNLSLKKKHLMQATSFR